MFQKRPKEGGIAFSGLRQSGKRTKLEVGVGDVVELRLEGERLRVKLDGFGKNSQFEGSIISFEPSQASQHKGLKVGQKIEFSEENIFGCSLA
jgi:hypothetical protein